MQTIKNFSLIRFKLFFLLFCFNIFANEISLELDQRLMDADWKFLPKVPASFVKNNYNGLGLNFEYNNIAGSYSKSKVDLQLQRNTEPRNVSLYATKEELNFGLNFNNKHIYVLASKQNAKPQVFNCYEFGNFILGFCEAANLQISSTNSKYEALGDNIISISGKASTIGLGYKKLHNNFWFESSSIEFVKTNYSYNWLTPLEDISSPFLLNITIDGVALGDALDSALMRLPQREGWESLQLNLGMKQKFYSIYNFNIIAEYDLIFLDFSNYAEYKMTQDINLRIRGGIEFYFENLSLLFYGDAYLNNLIGFEPITFNQRTEHYFDEPYGELGIKFKINL